MSVVVLVVKSSQVIDKLKFGTSLHQYELQDSIRVFVAKKIITMDPGCPPLLR